MRTRLCILMLCLAAAGASPAGAAVREIAPGEPLQAAVEAAQPGDVLRLLPGEHAGPLVIDRELALVGEAGAAVVGPGKGSVITLTVPGVRIEGLTIRGSGTDLPAMDSGILATRKAPQAVIRGNRFEGNLFGVYLHGAAGSRVEGNVMVGRRDLRLSEAGNGVSIWNAPGAAVVGNDVRYGRDGIFVTTSRDVLFQDNRFADLRFAIHYMYTQDSRVIGNRSERNHVGWAIMFSDRLEIRDNVSLGDRDHGLMLNAANESSITGNLVRDGGEKCVFIYNANKNDITGNRFEGCPIGIHFTAGSERNRVAGNAFIGNRTQVKYVGTRHMEWSAEGRGNFWSDHPGFDLDGDGVADTAYRPNDVMDEILWTLPQAKVLLNSPAVDAIRWAQARFPALYPGGVVDSAPLMRAPGEERP
ncbi:MAG TPA: nitrous oxide reductase family maturation protein NosD [Kiloniellaceae bacterium]|nr:nitrous oxide reductase family maturation protein NosD [Kiloniellaceae bacterium]